MTPTLPMRFVPWMIACFVARAFVGDAAAHESYELEAIVVTGTRTAHAVNDAPVFTQVITRRQIEATTSGNVSQLLDEIPDIYVRQNDEFRLGASTVRMQGADANKVAILLNGRRFRGGIDGVVDLRDIPVDSIERIEILRGPASSLYGSDAMGGVINIITRKAQSRPHLSATVAGGTFGRVLGGASHGARIGKLDYFLSYSHDEVEIAQQYGRISEQFAGAASDAKQQRDDVFVDLGYAAHADHRLGLSANYNPVREGPASEKENLSTSGAWTWSRGTSTTLDVSGSWYGFRRHNDLRGFEEDATYDDASGEARISHAAATGLRGETHFLTLGHRFRGESLRSKADPGSVLQIDTVDASATLYSGYVQDEVSLTDAWSLVLGASFDAHEFFGAVVNPRVHLTYRPSEWIRLSAGVGRGFRAPDLRQLFDVDANNIVRSGNRVTGYVILGNEDLEPETDLGVTAHAEFRPAVGLTATLGLFRHDFRDLIDVALACAGPTACVPGFVSPFPELSGQVFRYENVGAAVTQGGDVALRIEPLALLRADAAAAHRIELNLQYGFLHSRNDGDRPGEGGNELPFRPPHRFMPSLLHAFTPWGTELRLSAEYEDRTYTDLSNSADFIAESHWLFGARARWTPPRAAWLLGRFWDEPQDDALTLFVEATNLLDTEFGLATPMGRIAGQRMILGGIQLQL